MIGNKSLILVLALTLPIHVAAEDTPWYIGVAGGATEITDFPTPDDVRDAVGQEIDIGNANFPQENSLDDRDTAWKLFMGYNFNPYIGLEAFYADLGEANAKWSAAYLSGFPFIGGGKVGGSVDYSAETVGLYLVASYPFTERFSFHGKAGAHYYDAEVTVKAFSEGLAFVDTSISKTADDTGTDFVFGAGLVYDFSPRWGVTVEWERFSGVGFEGVDLDIEVLSAGLLFRF